MCGEFEAIKSECPPNINAIFDRMLDHFNKMLGEELEKCVRVMAEPPVKGEVTRGKLKWRGIVLKVKRNDFTSDEYWIEQRGKKISPTYTIELPKFAI